MTSNGLFKIDKNVFVVNAETEDCICVLYPKFFIMLLLNS